MCEVANPRGSAAPIKNNKQNIKVSGEKWQKKGKKGKGQKRAASEPCEQQLTLHLSLVVYDHARVVLEIEERAVLSAVRLPLSNDHRLHH